VCETQAVGLFRRNRFPKDLLHEAAANPGGSVAEIDPRYERDGFIPGSAVVGAWAVGANGKPTGDYVANPNFGVRAPLNEIGQILADVRALSGDETLELFIADELTYKSQPVRFDVGMAIVLDAVLGAGYTVGGPPEPLAESTGQRFTYVPMN